MKTDAREEKAGTGLQAAIGDMHIPPLFMRRFARLSSGIKLLLVMALFLAPLGIIALLAALESARTNARNVQTAARATVLGSASALDVTLARTELTLRAAGTALAGAPADPANCRRTLAALAAAGPAPVSFAILGPGDTLLCATRRFDPAFAGGPRGVTIAPDGSTLNFSLATAGGRAIGVASFPAAAIAAITHPVVQDDHYRLMIRAPGGQMAFGQPASAFPAGGLRAMAPNDGRRVQVELILPAQRLGASEILSILLPIVMLVAATAIAWLVMDRLMLQPLKRMQTAVTAYRRGDSALALPRFTTPAHEIRDLAQAFRSFTETIVRHEAELEEGLRRQTLLTREVHHRVKNNLQVVASLLNLHARGATSEAVADAYATIQRRVDALAVVHRNHFAELEENRGVALRPLIGELTANLRASAPSRATKMPILLDLEPFYATQDVAVPIAFLLTELVESAMLREPEVRLLISLKAAGASGRASLTISTPALAGAMIGGGGSVGARMERVVEGLSRQLRSSLVRDEAAGSLTIEISVVGDGAR